MRDQIKKALEAKQEEARQLYKVFADERKKLTDAGVDFAKDKEPFDNLNETHLVYAKAANEVTELQGRYEQAMEMEGSREPEAPRPLEPKADNFGEKATSPGDRFIESKAYKHLVESGALNHERGNVSTVPVETTSAEELKALLERKAVITGLSDTSAGAFVRSMWLPGMVDTLYRPLKVANLVSVTQTNSDTVEWVIEGAFTNAAAEVLEATSTSDGLKPESTLAFSQSSTLVQQIAHHMNVTRRSLADAPQVRDLINQRLRDGIEIRLDSQLINGNGTTPNLRGILNVSGLTTATAVGADARSVAVYKAMGALRAVFVEPTAVLMNPADWQDIRLEQDANGTFMWGPLSGIGGPDQIAGVPVVQSSVVAAGTAIVGDWRQAVLYVREGISVLVSENVSDFFLRNIITILAEARFAFAVHRPAAFTTVTGL